MPSPTRETIAGRVYNDLRNLARRTGRSTDEIMVEYVLEQFGARRMTRDIDILGRAFPNDEAEIIRRVAIIAATKADDGVEFDPDTLKTIRIRADEEYNGLRLTMAATIARARLKLQLDVSFGDPVTPEPQIIHYPQQLSTESFQIFGYPLATVIAEKLSTAISLGDLNTRERDYADLYRLATLHVLDGRELTAALTATAKHRGIPLRPLTSSITDLGERRQSSYAAWRRRQGTAASGYPDQFSHVVALVTTFGDPLLTGEAVRLSWHPKLRIWS